MAIETTNRCNASCWFCPNNAMQREKQTMSDDLFEKIIDDCTKFPLDKIEPFLNGEPLMDPKLIERLQLIRRKLPNTKLCLYTNGTILTPKKIDALVGLGIDRLYVSLNTLDPERYESVMGLKLERTLKNLDYLTHPTRRALVAKLITIRMTRTPDISHQEQKEFVRFCRKRGVRPFIVGPFNYKGDIPSALPVPNFPCEHITRVDILSNGRVALCCMDQEGQYSWGDIRQNSVLEVYNSEEALRYRNALRGGRRRYTEPCNACNLFWPSLDHMPLFKTIKFTTEYLAYLIKHRPQGVRRPDRSQ